MDRRFTLFWEGSLPCIVYVIGYKISCSLARDDKKAIELSEITSYIIPAFVIWLIKMQTHELY